jgi:hypothetical protein
MTSKQKLWRERVAAWQASGKTSDAFSIGTGFTGQQLRRWSSRLGKVAAQGGEVKGAAGAIRLALVRRGRPKGSKASPERVEPKPLRLEIGPVRITVERGFDREVLATVLGLLKVEASR